MERVWEEASFEGVELWKRNGGEAPGKSGRHGTCPSTTGWIALTLRSKGTFPVLPKVDISCVLAGLPNQRGVV